MQLVDSWAISQVMMVNCPALHRYKDVIIMPVTDMDRTLASRLSGGGTQSPLGLTAPSSRLAPIYSDYDGGKKETMTYETIPDPINTKVSRPRASHLARRDSVAISKRSHGQGLGDAFGCCVRI